MPWDEVNRVDQRVMFVAEQKSGKYSMTELCERFGVSRKTGYKWLTRQREAGWEGLGDRPRIPHSFPHRTPQEVESRIVEARRSHPSWGPKKLKAVLTERDPKAGWPAASTIGEILKRHGLVTPRRVRRRDWHPGRPVVEMKDPNDVWSVDFKGEFRLGSGDYCYPLTIVDGASRCLLACRGLSRPAEHPCRPVFERLFRENGLPRMILSDNGQPFASSAIGGLSRLSVWWVRLGIQPIRIERGHPEQNGRHERLHRTLKAETARPPRGSLPAQQRAFDRFRREYNDERPHEALGQTPPARHYKKSSLPFPDRLPKPEYPGHFEVRRVGPSGAIHWRRAMPFVAKPLNGQDVGLEEIDDGLWSLYFGPLLLGRLNERTGRTEGITKTG